MPTWSTEAIPIRTGTVHVQFFPEGGLMAAGIENRVYFAARDGKGQPLEIRGNIVDGKGASVTRVEAVRGGLGVFSFVPDAAETYRLKITSPAGISESPLLPPASAEQKIAIATGRGVFAPAPRWNSPSARRRTVCRWCHGPPARHARRPADARHFVAPIEQAKPNAVSIPLDDQVAGVIRLTVYDYTKSPPKVLAERLVYRQPRRLVVRAAEEKKPGGELVAFGPERERAARRRRFGTDGAPTAERTRTSPPDRCGPDLLHALLSDGDLENPAALEKRRFESFR